MNYTVCWKHMTVSIGDKCNYCESPVLRNFAVRDDLVCGFCNTTRPLSQNRCPVCSEWEKAHHYRHGEFMVECQAPSREDAHMIRLLLRSSLGYVPGVKWSRV